MASYNYHQQQPTAPPMYPIMPGNLSAPVPPPRYDIDQDPQEQRLLQSEPAPMPPPRDDIQPARSYAVTTARRVNIKIMFRMFFMKKKNFFFRLYNESNI